MPGVLTISRRSVGAGVAERLLLAGGSLTPLDRTREALGFGEVVVATLVEDNRRFGAAPGQRRPAGVVEVTAVDEGHVRTPIDVDRWTVDTRGVEPDDMFVSVRGNSVAGLMPAAAKQAINVEGR